ncbi:hypothetical protein DNTS_020280 [Danionella cerebrum]|uniref:Atos homolog protein A n=1 Tax=Danionella cerebrum TaxID=2873325 RepID=A0A553Q0J0_9TELE|nr:hypothetical protein DNTS_020280 [Danionella translucida]
MVLVIKQVVAVPSEAAEEFFEYDAEEFLVFLTLLITEGRTPECSVKGRTEGLHCPPAQSALPVFNKHECSDKIPQVGYTCSECREARRTRSEVMLLWRNHIPIMIEVMLLPDCCYSDDGPTTDCTDLNDPAIKQDALLLERWTLQPVPRQSGDRFIEEKTLLLAVRSYVFFSQLSAWLSASHGLVPRNILYRISAADEELIWNFSQTPSEHAFPVPNISHSVALKVRVQSLPRQPKYPILKCSIHSGLAFLGKRALECGEGGNQARENHNSLRVPGSPLLSRALHASASPHSPKNTPKYLPRPESPVPPGKAFKWLYTRLNGGVDTPSTEPYSQCTNGMESPKNSKRDSPTSGLKSLSITDPLVTPSPSPSSISGETNPLIGSLLQERQEVIARIAQRLNFCDPTAPHLPDGLFTFQEPGKAAWKTADSKDYLKISKEPLFQIPQQQSHNGTIPEIPERSRSSLFDTPLSPRSRTRLDPNDHGSNTSPKLSTCRRLVLSDQSNEGSLIAEAVQDISRLIQERLQHSYSLLNGTYKLKTSQHEQVASTHAAQNGFLSPPSHKKSNSSFVEKSKDESQPIKCSRSPKSCRRKQDSSQRPLNVASLKLEEHSVIKSQPSTANNYQQYVSRESWTSMKICSGHSSSPQENELKQAREQETFKTHITINEERAEKRGQNECTFPEKNENLDSWMPPSRTPAKPACGTSSPASDPPESIQTRSPTSPLKPCSNWKKQNRHSIDGSATKAFHPCTGLPLLSSPVPRRKSQTGCFDIDTSLIHCRGVPWAANKRVLRRSQDYDESEQLILSASAPPASLSLLGNFEECVLNHRLEPLGIVEGFTAEVGASGTFCPSHMTLPVDVTFYSVSDDNAPSPYMGVINLESLGKRGYRVPPSGTIQVTLFNPNKTVVKMFVVMYDLRAMPASHQTFLRQRTFSVPAKRDVNGHYRKPSSLGTGRTLRYLVHLRFQSSKSGKIYLHRDIRLLFSRKSMEVDSGAAYELKSFTESPADPPFSPRC